MNHSTNPKDLTFTLPPSSHRPVNDDDIMNDSDSDSDFASSFEENEQQLQLQEKEFAESPMKQNDHDDGEDEEQPTAYHSADYDIQNIRAEFPLSEEGENELAMTSDMMMHSHEAQQRQKANPWENNENDPSTDYRDFEHQVHVAHDSVDAEEDALAREDISRGRRASIHSDGADDSVDTTGLVGMVESIKKELTERELGNVYDLLIRAATPSLKSPRGDDTRSTSSSREMEEDRDLERESLKFIQSLSVDTAHSIAKRAKRLSIGRMSHRELQKEIEETVVTFGEERIDDEISTVCATLHDSLSMRKKYIRGQAIHPWEKMSRKNLGLSEELSPMERLLIEKTRQTLADPSHRAGSYKVIVEKSFDPFDTDVSSSSQKEQDVVFEMKEGCMQIFRNAQDKESGRVWMKPAISYLEHYADYKKLATAILDPATKGFAFNRLKMLELKFTLYKVMNERSELKEQKAVPHRDFYNVRKVDTHIHLTAAMNQKKLLKYIKRKLRAEPDSVVIERDGKQLTLEQVFQSLNLTAYDLSVDTLDVHADNTILHRFDKFNLKYSPFGQSRLREVFLKTDNFIHGRYFAELTKEFMEDLEESKYVNAEVRVSIYGRRPGEWDDLAKWVINNKLFSDNTRWLIQIPRLFGIHKQHNIFDNFQDMLRNIFEPLFEVTRDPASHPELHAFLKQVVGFDSVDDESKPEGRFHSRLPRPNIWNTTDNPPYAYYTYYFWANINVLNEYRSRKNLGIFKFRPHCGEAGDVTHLVSAFLLADSINHGIELRRSPVLQYLYYLTQIGLALSPLSNNSLFLKYARSPLPQFFDRGLNVSLSTDDPLMFHTTREPLIEEYAIAAQVFNLSGTDMCELARNSVLQSGWEHIFKCSWVSPTYYLPGPAGNIVGKTNVPNVRLSYRYETLIDEHLFIMKTLFHLDPKERAKKSKSPMPLTERQFLALINRDKPYFEKLVDTMFLGKAVPQGDSPLMVPQSLMPNYYGPRRSASQQSLSDMEHHATKSDRSSEGSSSASWTSNVLRIAGFMSLFVLTGFLSKKHGSG